MKQPKNYRAAFQELQEILASMQDESADPEELMRKVQRARELLDFCRKKLREAEDSIQQAEKES